MEVNNKALNTMVYLREFDSKYRYGIFSMENDLVERPWLYRCYKEFEEFRIGNSSIWEQLYQPGINILSIGREEGNRLVRQVASENSITDVGLGEREILSKVQIGSDKLESLEWDKEYTNFRESSLENLKGYSAENFVVSKLDSAKEVESLISFTRIHGPGDILPQDRVVINKNSIDFKYNIEQKVYNIDYLDNVENKDLLHLIEVEEPLRVLEESDLSFGNVGGDVVVGLGKKEVSEGFLGFEKILYELNVLPASSWAVNFIFFVAGAVAFGTAVWGFYYALGKLKAYLELNGTWDPSYNYWEILMDCEKGFKRLKPEIEKIYCKDWVLFPEDYSIVEMVILFF